MSRSERKRVSGGGVQYVISMRAAFQWFCYDNGLLLSALHHRHKQQTRVSERIQCCSNPTMFHMMRHNQMRAAAAQARGGRGVRGWTWECIPSCSVVAGPAVPHPHSTAIRFHLFVGRRGTRFHGLMSQTLNDFPRPSATHEKSSVGVEM